MQGLSKVRTDVQMCMLQEPVGGFRELMEEDVGRLVNFVVELIRDGNVEETVEQPAVDTPRIPVTHQGEGPRTSQSGINGS